MASININTLITNFSAITVSSPAPLPSQFLRPDLTNEEISLAQVDEAAAPSAIVDRTSGFTSGELDAIVDAITAFRLTPVEPMFEALLEIAAQLEEEPVVPVESYAMDMSPDILAEETCEPMDETDEDSVVESGAMDLSEEVVEVAMLTDAMEYREVRKLAVWEM